LDTQLTIFSLFLVESVIVSLPGSILGTIIGELGAYALKGLLRLPLVFPFMLIVEF
jgi:ABC-type lipoprotein release transport system permease subunit